MMWRVLAFLLGLLVPSAALADWGVTKDPVARGDLRYCELNYKFGPQSVEGIDQIVGIQSYKQHGDLILFKHWNAQFFNGPVGLDVSVPEAPLIRNYITVISPAGVPYTMMGNVAPDRLEALFTAFTTYDGGGANITLRATTLAVEVPAKHSKIMIAAFKACKAKL